MKCRKKACSREIQAIIAAGGVHQDTNGWWIDDTTDELSGPDPDIGHPRSAEDMKNVRPARDVLSPSFFKR